MYTPFDIASGSIVGNMHRKMNYNNQDALLLAEGEEYCVGIVCDGCGSRPHSEVGAKLTAQFMVGYIADKIEQQQDWTTTLEIDTLSFLRNLAQTFKQVALEDFVYDYLLFTTIGFVVTTNDIIFFYNGDGVLLINNDFKIIEQNNRPLYLSYNLVRDDLDCHFSIEKQSTKTVQQFGIGTDGWMDWLQHIEKGFNRFASWDEVMQTPDLYTNPALLSKWLQNQSESGILGDDTSLILAKKSF